MRAFLTYSEMNELASRAFLISFEKTKSKDESKALFIVVTSSFSRMTAFLLRVDLKLSLIFAISGTMDFKTAEFKRSE